jgi:hypothetical protein
MNLDKNMFLKLKSFRKAIKQEKKQAYKQSIYDKLSDSLMNNPSEL